MRRFIPLFVFAITFLLPLRATAQSSCAAAAGSRPNARVTFDLGNGTTAVFPVRSFTLGVEGPPTAHDSLASAPSGSTSVQLVKNAGQYTSEFVRRSAAGEVSPQVLVEVLDSAGTPTLTLRLTNAIISADRVTLSNARAGLDQQRIAQQEALSQLTADYQDAQRELSTTEQLGKTRVSTPLELARARDRAAELGRRLELAKQRQSLLLRQLDEQGFVDEELTLHFSQIDINNRG